MKKKILVTFTNPTETFTRTYNDEEDIPEMTEAGVRKCAEKIIDALEYNHSDSISIGGTWTYRILSDE